MNLVEMLANCSPEDSLYFDYETGFDGVAERLTETFMESNTMHLAPKEYMRDALRGYLGLPMMHSHGEWAKRLNVAPRTLYRWRNGNPRTKMVGFIKIFAMEFYLSDELVGAIVDWNAARTRAFQDLEEVIKREGKNKLTVALKDMPPSERLKRLNANNDFGSSTVAKFGSTAGVIGRSRLNIPGREEYE